PVGRFRITFKYRSDDMSPEQSEHRDYFIADVPFALYFQQPFAIHVAYWHETFGMPMSGGCINVSPRDGERLFTMTSPRVPDDWYAAGPSPVLGQGTQIVVRR
ncbi:MAG TPA: L,D-transpeptidase, partial [Polyangiaceae bacterium]|nr:L,D-transpeptidase [Polyangiaceae bacterium]